MADSSPAHASGLPRVATPVKAWLPGYKLVATAGLLSGRSFSIGREGLTIGRDPGSCQVIIADDEVSRVHAWIGFNESGELILRDQGSANGIYVNQIRVEERPVRSSDQIGIGTGGRHLFRVDQPQER